MSKLNCSNFSPLDPEVSPSRVSDGASSLPTFLLMHLVSLVGQVALQQVVYLEVSVSAELRRRRLLKEKTKKCSNSSTKQQRPRVRTEGFFRCEILLVSQLLLQQNSRMHSRGCVRSRVMHAL